MAQIQLRCQCLYSELQFYFHPLSDNVLWCILLYYFAHQESAATQWVKMQRYFRFWDLGGSSPQNFRGSFFWGGGGSPLHSPISKWGDINNVWVHQLHLSVITHFLYSRLYALSLTSLILIMIFIFRFGGKCSPPPEFSYFLILWELGGGVGGGVGIPLYSPPQNTPETASPCTNPFKFCLLIFHQYS